MKNKIAIVIGCLLLVGCSSTRQVGDVVYEKVAFPSVFGPYQAIIVSYPVGHTNLQRIITKDANPGPGATIAGAAIQAGGYVGGQAVRRPSKVTTTTSVSGGNVDGGNVHGGDFSTGAVTVDGSDVQVNNPGSRDNNQ